MIITIQKVKKPSVIPIYGIGATFLLYNVFFPMYRLVHLLICVALAVASYVVLRKFCPDRIVEIHVPDPTTGNPELDEAIAQGRAYVAEIKRLNDAIPDQKLSEALDEIAVLMQKIFRQVELEQTKLPKIRKMMSYYLPTTIKLVRKYAELQEQRGLSSVDRMLEEIAAMLETVKTAFRKQLESLYEHDVIDITADIQVMEQMLAAHGLTDTRDFETRKENA